MSAQQLAQALRRLIAELPVRVTNDQQLISLSVAHIEGIGQACVKVLQAIEAAPQQAQAPSSSDYVIELLKAAGHVTAEQVERARAIAAQHYPLQQAQAPGWQLVPVEPPEGLLMSMALRFDHGLGCPGYYDQFPRFPGDSHQKRLEGVLTQMRQIYEEVSGAGFYRPDLEESYKAMAAPQQGSNT